MPGCLNDQKTRQGQTHGEIVGKVVGICETADGLACELGLKIQRLKGADLQKPQGALKQRKKDQQLGYQ